MDHNQSLTHSQLERKAYLNWLLEDATSYTHAVTLTLKPYRTVLSPKGQLCIALTPIEAQQNFQFFLKRLNASLFGNQVKRYGKSVSVLPVLEGDGRDHLLHYHCAIGNFPAALPQRGIQAKIIASWHQTPFGNDQVHIQPFRNSGWLSYIAKQIGTRNEDAVDIQNLRRPNASLT
jgi:hypothetical protein